MPEDTKTTIPSEEVQRNAVASVVSSKALWKSLCYKRRRELETLYREVMGYEGNKRAKWASTLKVNFANQIESLVTARITARSPKFIVSNRIPIDQIVDKYYPVKEPEATASLAEIEAYKFKKKEQKKFRKEVTEWVKAVQDWLNFAFSEYGYAKKVRLGAKTLVRYGNVYGSVRYRVEKYRKRRNGKIIEDKGNEYPELQMLTFSNILLDPRYIDTTDSPGVIIQEDFERVSELYALNEDLFNLDKIKTMPHGEFRETKQQIYLIKISNADGTNTEKEVNRLSVDKFFGYYNPDPDDPEKECIYEIWVVAESLVIKFKEIPRIPVRSAACFEDVEQHFSTGYVEPILGLQREYNFKLNSSIEYINQSLNRSWFWSPTSGVDPKQLINMGPGSFIVASKGVSAAMEGLREIDYKPIPNEYFASQNETRRDMQSLSFTIDTTAPSSQQGFTNTATAVRARFFESNVMYADTLKHYEEFLVNLAYDLIDSLAENADDDIIVGRLGSDRFKFAKKEIFEDAPLRYSIRAEVGASSFDSVESRREEALALWTIAKEAKEAGEDIDLAKVVEFILLTFEGITLEDLKKKDIEGLTQEVMAKMQGGQTTSSEIEAIQNAPEPGLEDPSALTEAVVKGGLTE